MTGKSLDILNAEVTTAVYDAEESLETAIEDWVDLEAAEQAIADHPDTPFTERTVAFRGLSRAQTVLAVLRGLLDAPKVIHEPLDSEPYKILVKWRADLSDKCGDDLICHITHVLTNPFASGGSEMPPELKPTLESFRKLDHATQLRHIEAALPEDVELARRENV